MRFKTIFLIFSLAMFMLTGVAFAKEEEDKYAEAIEKLKAEVAELQAQVNNQQTLIEAIISAFEDLHTQTANLQADYLDYKSKDKTLILEQKINLNAQNIATNAAEIAENTAAIASNTTAIDLLGDMALDRFTDMGDGTIRLNHSNLFWLKNANCSELYGGEKGLNWEEASDTVANLADGICGLADGSVAGDWRLPTVEEWGDLISKEFTSPALDNTVGDGPWQEGDAFTGVQLSDYWTSATTWAIDMDQGKLIQRGYYELISVWPVRNR